MIYTAEARQNLRALEAYYRRKMRPEALKNLIAVMAEAERQIEMAPETGLPSPRPYPDIARAGIAWMKLGGYWVAYRPTPPFAIVAVFYETADIPRRFSRQAGGL